MWWVRDSPGSPQSTCSGWMLISRPGDCAAVCSKLVPASQVNCRRHTCPCIEGGLLSSRAILHAAVGPSISGLERYRRQQLPVGGRGGEASGHGKLTITSTGRILRGVQGVRCLLTDHGELTVYRVLCSTITR